MGGGSTQLFSKYESTNFYFCTCFTNCILVCNSSEVVFKASLSSSVLLYSVNRWGVKVNPHIPQFILPFNI